MRYNNVSIRLEGGIVMPHSSGGGSSGGGSHGGSYGGGSGGSAPKVSRTYYPGSVRYVARHNDKERYFYADRNFNPKYDKKRLLLILFYLPFLFFIVLSFKSALPIVKKDYDHSIVIKDDADVIGNEWALQESLKKFMDRTGVTPSVITVFEDEWSDKYTSLEEYAFDRYLAEFNDEMHWLIVYSKPRSYTSDDGFIDWKWEGMQGNDTDPVLKKRETDKFNEKLQALLTDETIDAGTAITTAFNEFSEDISLMPQLSVIIMPLFMLGFIIFHAYFMLGLNELKYANAVPAPEESTNGISSTLGGENGIRKEIVRLADEKSRKNCPYCGAEISVLTNKRCPCCDALISDEQEL